MVLQGANGPSPGVKYGIQSIATRQTPAPFNPPLARPGEYDQALNEFPESGLGPGIGASHQPQSGPGSYSARSAIGDSNRNFFWELSRQNEEVQTQDYPSGDVGFNLSVSNLPDGAQGNLSAPVTYQEINVHGGVAPSDAPAPERPYLSLGPGGYRARMALYNEQGPAYSHRRVQSIATAQQAHGDRALTLDESATRGFPWWQPTAERGPLGNARFALSNTGGGYVSPTAYRAGAHESTLAPPSRFAPIEDTSPVGTHYLGTYSRDVARPNTIDIQTQDFPGGEVGFNLSVGNLPIGAQGNLDAPVTYQQLTPAGGVGSADEPNNPRDRPWLDQNRVYG